MPNNGASDDSSGSGSGGGGNGTTLKKGPWTAAEDAILMEYVKKHGEGNWNAVQKNSGLSRCGKSCRLRWANHLRPNLKKGSFSPEEERLILELHSKLGNKWARMAAQLPGRTDNEIKNYWNTRVKRRQRAGLPLYPHDIQKQASNFHHHQNNQQHQHQHQHHHPRVSQSPSPQLSLASSQQQKPNFMTPLSIFDPINFSNTMPLLSHQTSSPFLSSPSQGYKRFRDNNVGGFSNSFTLPTTSLTQSTMFNQSLFPSSNLQFSSSNYELNPPSLLQSQFEHNGVMASGSSYIKSELPSYQSSLPISTSSPMGGSHEYKISSFARSNSGLLDALLQESDVMGGREDGRKEGLTSHHDSKAELNDFLSNGPRQFFNEGISALPLGSRSHWDEASSTPLPGGVKLKKESTEEIDSVEDDDLSSLLDIIPTTMMVSDLYHESAETSNGQSSGVTEEEVGLDLQPLPPCSFPDSTPGNTATGDQDWTIGNWSTVPEMC